MVTLSRRTPEETATRPIAINLPNIFFTKSSESCRIFADRVQRTTWNVLVEAKLQPLAARLCSTVDRTHSRGATMSHADLCGARNRSDCVRQWVGPGRCIPLLSG